MCEQREKLHEQIEAFMLNEAKRFYRENERGNGEKIVRSLLQQVKIALDNIADWCDEPVGIQFFLDMSKKVSHLRDEI